MRVYSQNVCCLPTGARELHLQKSGLFGAVAVTVLWMWLAYVALDYGVPWSQVAHGKFVSSL